MSRLFTEIRWLVQVAISIFLLLSLISYDRHDPAWTHSAQVDRIANWGGLTGARVSDMLLLLFGVSAYWLLLFVARHVAANYHRISGHALPGGDAPAARHRAGVIAECLSFALVVVSSVGLESMRMWSLKIPLPLAPGGVLGDLVARGVGGALGFTGGTLALMLSLAIGLSLFFQFSWLDVCERVGGAIISGVTLARLRHEAERDRKAGEAAAVRREDKVERSRARTEEQASGQPASGQPASGRPAGTAERGAAFERTEPVAHPVTIERPAPATSRVDAGAAAAGIAAVGTAAAAGTRAGNGVSGAAAAAGTPAEALTAGERQAHLFPDAPGEGSLPALGLLDPPPQLVETVSDETLEYTSRLIEKKLKDFGVEASVVAAYPGPVVTRYEIEPATGVKGSQIVNLAKDLARALSLVSIRVVETIPGKNYMALELPNARRQTVRLSEILGADVYTQAASPLTMGLGKDIGGQPVVADLAKMPHLLVAGTTGSGKSVGINAMILSLLYKASADQVRMILIDPKMLEMSTYEGIPHLLCPVVTDMSQAGHALNWTVAEMERRYKLLSKLGVRNLAGYNAKIAEADARGEKLPNPFSLTPEAPEPLHHLPAIVVVIDELADLMMVVGKKVEELIARIAQKARAAGIHLILATQRPSVDVITGLIKANVPTRMAFQVSSKIDSRTILDQQGADTLLGMGDMLYLPPGSGVPVRVHGAFVSDDEVHRVVENLRAQGEPNYIDGILEGGVAEGAEGEGMGGGAAGESDPLYDQAVEIVVKNRRASISLVQRHLRIGYNRAARLLEQMENSGMVSPMGSNGNREILVPHRDTE